MPAGAPHFDLYRVFTHLEAAPGAARRWAGDATTALVASGAAIRLAMRG
jgi:hypothetical protein